jgi:hypothetical protein
MTKFTEFFQNGLDAYYEDANIDQLRHKVAQQGAEQLADFNAGYVCAEEQDAL